MNLFREDGTFNERNDCPADDKVWNSVLKGRVSRMHTHYSHSQSGYTVVTVNYVDGYVTMCLTVIDAVESSARVYMYTRDISREYVVALSVNCCNMDRQVYEEFYNLLVNEIGVSSNEN